MTEGPPSSVQKIKEYLPEIEKKLSMLERRFSMAQRLMSASETLKLDGIRYLKHKGLKDSLIRNMLDLEEIYYNNFCKERIGEISPLTAHEHQILEERFNEFLSQVKPFIAERVLSVLSGLEETPPFVSTPLPTQEHLNPTVHRPMASEWQNNSNDFSLTPSTSPQHTSWIGSFTPSWQETPNDALQGNLLPLDLLMSWDKEIEELVSEGSNSGIENTPYSASPDFTYWTNDFIPTYENPAPTLSNTPQLSSWTVPFTPSLENIDSYQVKREKNLISSQNNSLLLDALRLVDKELEQLASKDKKTPIVIDLCDDRDVEIKEEQDEISIHSNQGHKRKREEAPKTVLNQEDNSTKKPKSSTSTRLTARHMAIENLVRLGATPEEMRKSLNLSQEDFETRWMPSSLESHLKIIGSDTLKREREAYLGKLQGKIEKAKSKDAVRFKKLTDQYNNIRALIKAKAQELQRLY